MVGVDGRQLFSLFNHVGFRTFSAFDTFSYHARRLFRNTCQIGVGSQQLTHILHLDLSILGLPPTRRVQQGLRSGPFPFSLPQKNMNWESLSRSKHFPLVEGRLRVPPRTQRTVFPLSFESRSFLDQLK